jgi:hypothetical protein
MNDCVSSASLENGISFHQRLLQNLLDNKLVSTARLFEKRPRFIHATWSFIAHRLGCAN